MVIDDTIIFTDYLGKFDEKEGTYKFTSHPEKSKSGTSKSKALEVLEELQYATYEDFIKSQLSKASTTILKNDTARIYAAKAFHDKNNRLNVVTFRACCIPACGVENSIKAEKLFSEEIEKIFEIIK